MSDATRIKRGTFIPGPQLHLADALRREGRYDEARAQVEEELRSLAPRDDAGRLACAVERAKVEHSAESYAVALRVLMGASPLAEALAEDEPELVAKFYSTLGAARQSAGDADGALDAYAAASHMWKRAGSPFDAGATEANVGLILGEAGDARAFDYFEQARGHFRGDAVKLAEVDESEARVLLTMGEPRRALRLLAGAWATFDAHDEVPLLLGALPTLIKAAADYQAEAGK